MNKALVTFNKHVSEWQESMKAFMKKFLKYFIFDFEETWTSFKFKNFYSIFKFTYADTVSKAFLSVNFARVAPLSRGFDKARDKR